MEFYMTVKISFKVIKDTVKDFCPGKWKNFNISNGFSALLLRLFCWQWSDACFYQPDLNQRMLGETHCSEFKATLSLLLLECCWNDDIKYPTLSHTTLISLYVSLQVYIKTITVIKARLVDLPMNCRESSIGEVTSFVWKI